MTCGAAITLSAFTCCCLERRSGLLLALSTASALSLALLLLESTQCAYDSNIALLLASRCPSVPPFSVPTMAARRRARGRIHRQAKQVRAKPYSAKLSVRQYPSRWAREPPEAAGATQFHIYYAVLIVFARLLFPSQ